MRALLFPCRVSPKIWERRFILHLLGGKAPLMVRSMPSVPPWLIFPTVVEQHILDSGRDLADKDLSVRVWAKHELEWWAEACDDADPMASGLATRQLAAAKQEGLIR